MLGVEYDPPSELTDSKAIQVPFESTKTRFCLGTCYVDYLPNEIPVVIFHRVVNGFKERYIMQRGLSKVCSRWHRIVITIKSLWSCVNVSISPRLLDVCL